MIGIDERVFRACYAGGGAGGLALHAMIAATVLGSGWSMLALLPLIARARSRRFAASLTATLLATAAVVLLLKTVVRRARPCVSLDGVRALFGDPVDFSFPSGHAAGSFAFAAFVIVTCVRRARADPDLAPPLFAASAAVAILAVGVAFSRVYLGVHFPGDVFAGAAVGASIGVAGARAGERLLAPASQDDTQ